MNIVLQLLLICVMLLVVPFLSGALFVFCAKRDSRSVALSFVAGFAVMLGVFQAIALPMSFMDATLAQAQFVWLAVMCGLCVASAVLHRKRFRSAAPQALPQCCTASAFASAGPD